MVQARREALGLSQVQLARWLPWKHTRLSEIESDRRSWPEWAEGRLCELETLFDEMVAGIVEQCLDQEVEGAEARVIETFKDDGTLWEAHPGLRGLPAVLHRIAAVEAWKTLLEDGIMARIVAA